MKTVERNAGDGLIVFSEREQFVPDKKSHDKNERG